MSYLNLEQLSFADSMQMDAFNRLRVSSPKDIFESQMQYETGLTDWSSLVAGAGSVSHLPNESSVLMSTGGTALGDKAYRSTKLCWRYQPGKSQFVFQTFLFGSAISNVRRRVGYFNTNDGIFFEQTDQGLFIVLRTSTSGAPVDERVAQVDWNIDTLGADPSRNPSGDILDITTAQHLVIDMQWLGVGRVRVGFSIDGRPVLAHKFAKSNIITSVYMKTANLPLRLEIENTGVAGSAATMKQICSSIISEGGDLEGQRGSLRTASNGTSRKAVTTRRPILSIRPAATFFGQPNRAWYIPIEASVLSDADAFLEVVFGGTLTGAVWTAAGGGFSSVEYDTSATAITGGTSVISGHVSAPGSGANSTGAAVANVSGRFPNSVDDLLGTQLGHTIVATSMSGTANMAAAANWREIF